MRRSQRLSAPLIAAIAAMSVGGNAEAQWSTAYEQFYLPASHNWAFRNGYSASDRLFNAFDYGHAILYETLYTEPDAPASRLEGEIYDRLTGEVLVDPPRLPLEEGAIEIAYAKLAPEAKVMFDWAHILHRQIYDVLGDERIPDSEKDGRVAELIRYYRSRPDVAFSSRPKNMELMEGQYYSTVFRNEYPKFNGLIWAYHWLQVGLYEPLLAATTQSGRVTGVSATTARFWQMIENAPEHMPRVMPMTAAVAPRFAARFPEAAIIFDNLHSMHDVVSDILASDAVPRNQKRQEILRAAERYRDDTSFVMTEREWAGMSVSMGVDNMGGPATDVLIPPAAATIAPGAVMDHAAHGQAPSAAGAAPEAQPSAAIETTAMDLLMRLLQDPVTRERIATDSSLRALVDALIEGLPSEHHGHLRSMLPPANSSPN
jgi:hypothetical protein